MKQSSLITLKTQSNNLKKICRLHKDGRLRAKHEAILIFYAYTSRLHSNIVNKVTLGQE